MSQGEDSQAKSVPEIKKIELLGRNVQITKLKLGAKIKVSRTFAKLAKALKGDNWVRLTDGSAVPRKLDMADLNILDVIESLPNFLHMIEVEYPEFLALTTDLTDDEVQELDIPDLIVVADATWQHNGFDKSMEDALGKVLRDGPAKEPIEQKEPESQEPSKT